MRLALISLLLCFSTAALSQSYIDVLKIQYTNTPYDGIFRQSDKGVDFDRFNVSASLPIPLKQHYIILYPGYEEQDLEYEDTSPTTIRSTYLPLTFLYQWKDERWKTAFTYIVRTNGDHDQVRHISEENIQHGFAALFIRKKSDDLTYKFGAYFNNELFGIFVLPLLGIDYKINEQWSLFGTLPREIYLNRKFGEKANAGMVFNARTNSYRIHDTLKKSFYDIRENQLKAFANLNLFSNIVVYAEAGHTFFRRSKLVFNGEELNEDINDAFVLRLGAAFRVSTD